MTHSVEPLMRSRLLESSQGRRSEEADPKGGTWDDQEGELRPPLSGKGRAPNRPAYMGGAGRREVAVCQERAGLRFGVP